jgi:nucleoid-associated protein EbfC
MRQGGDPRLPVELALVKVTRPGSDLSAESTAYRLEQLEQRGGAPLQAGTGTAVPVPEVSDAEPEAAAEPPSLELTQLQEAWQRTVLPAVERRSIPTASMLREAHPAALADDRLTLEFPASAPATGRGAEERQSARGGTVRGHRQAPPAGVCTRGERGAARRDGAPERGGLRRADQGDLRRAGGGRFMTKGFDMNQLLQQAQQMQAQMAVAQEQLAKEIVEASAGGGLVTVKATGAGEITEIKIDPKAIDPDDPELLEDTVLAAVNEALRSAQALVQSKLGGTLGSLGLPGL